MKTFNIIMIAGFVILLLVGVASADVIDNRTYHSEETAVPIEVFSTVLIVGISFFTIASVSAFLYNNAAATMLFGIISTLFLTLSAYTAPVVGKFDYIVNETSGTATPVVWLTFQPWMMWLLWGVAVISFIVFVYGVLLLFTERAHKDDMYWV